MKKIGTLMLTLDMALSLAACGNNSNTASTISTASSNESSSASETAAPENITIQSFNANKEEVDLQVPYDAQRIAVMDMASLDILDRLGLGSRSLVLPVLPWIICKAM